MSDSLTLTASVSRRASQDLQGLDEVLNASRAKGRGARREASRRVYLSSDLKEDEEAEEKSQSQSKSLKRRLSRSKPQLEKGEPKPFWWILKQSRPESL